MKKDDYGFYGKGIDGYVHYKQAFCINRSESSICTDFQPHFHGLKPHQA